MLFFHDKHFVHLIIIIIIIIVIVIIIITIIFMQEAIIRMAKEHAKSILK
jgi:uncharacterized membrane protein YqiK